MIGTTLLLETLGFIMHPIKSVLVPTQEIVVIGFVINSLTLTVLLPTLKTFATDKSHTHIRIMTDNSTAVNVINHMGISHSQSCNPIAKKIWECCIERHIWLSVAYIPGKDNFVADSESRRNQKEAEWMLSKARCPKRVRFYARN